MEQLSKFRFISVDDDPINNTIAKLTIQMVTGAVEVQSFTQPQEGLDFIKERYVVNQDLTPTILLLDINMPGLNGWEFLDRFDQFNNGVKSVIKVFILSSSIDPRDKERSYSNKNVSDFIVKPLITDVVTQMLNES